MMTESEFKKLPVSQRKAIQERLKNQGLYSGGIDGSWGAGTETAIKEEERRRVEKEQRDRAARTKETTAKAEAKKTEAEAAKSTAETAETERKTKARAEYEQQASSPLGLATRSAASLASPALATALGYYAGGKLNDRLNRGQARRNETLRGAAEDRVRGLTTREGAVTGTRLAGAMPPRNALLRVGSRMAPHAGLGLLAAGKGATLLADTNEDQPFYPRMADRAAGLGYIGFGSGLIKRGLEQAASPGVSPDAQALSVINSNQLRRNTALPASANRGQIIDAEVIPEQARSLPATESPSDQPTPGSKAYYVQEAKRLGIKGATRKNKAALVEAVNQANAGNAARRVRTPKVIPGIAGPAIAAGLAYLATPTDAQAGTGQSATGQDEALTNAGIAGGITAGANRLLRVLPRAAPYLNAVGAGLAAYDYANQAKDYRETLPENIGANPQERTAIASVLPLAMQGALMVEDVRSAPERIQRFVAENQTDPTLAMSEEVQALPPQQEPDDFESQMADLERLFAEMNDQPVQNASVSYQAAQIPQTAFSQPQIQNRLLRAGY